MAPEQSLRVLLLTRYGPLGASSRLRAYQYLPYLRSQGFHITTVPLLGDYYHQDLQAARPFRLGKIAAGYLRRILHLARSPSFDLLWIEYELFPWVPAVAERLLAGLRVPYVVEYDDAIYHRYELHSSRLVRRLLGNKIDVIMRRASTVLVGNEYLGGRAHAASAQRVEKLPTVVDLERYATKPLHQPAQFTIGWIGSLFTVKYLSLIGPVLADFCRTWNARLVVVGAKAPPMEGVAAESRPWSEATEAEDILGFDVGIMPLPDEPWERGKCGYKLIQYMACARPVIASPVGVNHSIVDHGVNGFLASTNQEWRAALEALFAAPELRARMGRAGRAKVETKYCTRVTSPLLADILRRAASGNGARP